ncbi:phage major capsid protein [Nocardia cyriacigeorgica]|uniref:Phage major capsid protein n=1 Tax=Nocardia cyriacigeorgica TaxID=135487 RepID=A0ABX0CWF0_9NOCA|nr:phage major capsid protein [Nocardia cyriacigeorgica]NEW58590.1 phage major capsid protein [Nocardia cyriacigeorgica]
MKDNGLRDLRGNPLGLEMAKHELSQLRTETAELVARGTDLAGDDADRFTEATERAAELRAFIERVEQRAEQAKSEFAEALRTGKGLGRYERGGGGNWDTVRATSNPTPLAGQAILTRDQKLTDWSRDNGHSDSDGGNFGLYLRGLATGDWSGAQHERAMVEGTLSAGGHLVPTPLANKVIDLARNATQVVRAGAVTVPMTAATLKIPRLTGEGSPAWRNEGAAITAGDLAFDAVTFTARSLDRLVILSRELFQDSDPSAGDIIAQSFAAQIAVELDRVALRGSGSAPEPRGVLNTSGITTTTHGANGTAISSYDWFLDAAGAVRNNNYEPTGHIVAPRTGTSLAKLKNSQNDYLVPPATMLPMYGTKQVPINLTVGTSNDASEIYTGQWDLLALGIRHGFEIELLRERYADTGQVAFVAHLRADVQVLQPAAFVVDTGVRG